MGFTPGAEVEMTHNYGRGPLIVSVRGANVALGRGEARHISIEREPA
jgi:Fe2+ transport system protein FeoA